MDLLSRAAFRDVDLANLAADHSLTAALAAAPLVCLHGSDAYNLTASALGAVLDLAGQGQTIVYVACEGAAPVAALVARLRTARQTGAVTGLFVLPAAVNLLKPANVEALAQVIARKVGRPGLLVLDCLAYCFGGDERNPEAMQRFVAHLGLLQAQTGAPLLLLHRTGLGSVRGVASTGAPPPGMTLVHCPSAPPAVRRRASAAAS